MHEGVRTGRLGLGEVMSVGWEQYWLQFWKLVPIFLIVYIPINFGLSFIPVDELIEAHGMRGFRMYMKIIQLLEFFIGVIATMSLAVLIDEAIRGRAISWQTALKRSVSRWGAAIWTGILAGLIILGMTLLLIVPGIIWSFYYAFFAYVVVLRGLSGKRALDYSKAMVKGQWWRVFGYLLVINIIGFFVGLVASVPFCFTPENQLLDIVSDTLIDIVSALFMAMTIVFFLNNDYLKMTREPAGESAGGMTHEARELSMGGE